MSETLIDEVLNHNSLNLETRGFLIGSNFQFRISFAPLGAISTLGPLACMLPFACWEQGLAFGRLPRQKLDHSQMGTVTRIKTQD